MQSAAWMSALSTAKTDEEGKELLKALGAPFAENN